MIFTLMCNSSEQNKTLHAKKKGHTNLNVIPGFPRYYLDDLIRYYSFYAFGFTISRRLSPTFCNSTFGITLILCDTFYHGDARSHIIVCYHGLRLYLPGSCLRCVLVKVFVIRLLCGLWSRLSISPDGALNCTHTPPLNPVVSAIRIRYTSISHYAISLWVSQLY